MLNPMFVHLLRSPLHGLLSKQLAVLTIKGRKSGQRYDIPIGYTQLGDTLYFGTEARWARNLAGGAPVLVRLRGQDRHALAEVIRDEAGMLAAYRAYLPQAPRYAQLIGIRLNAQGEPNRDDVARARRAGHVVIRARLR